MWSIWKLRLQMLLLDILDLFSFLVFVTGVVLFIRFFVINPYTVVGQSMEPTFSERDFIIVDKMTPRWGEIKRWDIIVFVPQNKTLPFIKRVIGMPNEHIKVEEGKTFLCTDATFSDCEELEEIYLPSETYTSIDRCDVSEFSTDDTWFLVFGDNRDHSTDSRCCFWLACYEGANYLVYPEDMIGKVMMRMYPSMDPYW